jgi:MYXO-CTERM domain-containing protein
MGSTLALVTQWRMPAAAAQLRAAATISLTLTTLFSSRNRSSSNPAVSEGRAPAPLAAAGGAAARRQRRRQQWRLVVEAGRAWTDS